MGASGVVWCSGLGMASPPKEYCTVEMNPAFFPTSRSSCHTKDTVELFPSVPVTPMTTSLEEGES